MRTYTPIFDLSAHFPLVQRRSTVLLHPRRQIVTEITASKLGGHIAWPKKETWPKCPFDNDPMIPILQLARADVPELGFPDGKDLFQMLWCPRQDHELAFYAPAVKCFWRTSADIGEIMSTLPRPADSADENCIPVECKLHFERVEEYPAIYAISDDVREEIDDYLDEHAQEDLKNVDADDGLGYGQLFAAAPVSKVGGHFSWVQDPMEVKCEKCGGEMEHLVTIASRETGTLGRWDMIDEEHPESNTKQTLSENVDPVYTTDLCINDMGSLFVAVCRKCPDMHIQTLSQ